MNEVVGDVVYKAGLIEVVAHIRDNQLTTLPYNQPHILFQ